MVGEPAYRADMTIVELRQYTLHPGRRGDLVALFDRKLVEPQEQHGLQVIGTFVDLEDPDRFVWLRGFPDMPSRKAGLEAFYDGPVWQAHKHAANATMIDSDDVLVLRPTRPFAAGPAGVVVVTVLSLAQPAEQGFLAWYEDWVEPVLAAAGSATIALLVTDPSPNTFPRLPVRQGEWVHVRIAGFASAAALVEHQAALAATPGWAELASQLAARTVREPQVLLLSPTPRSRLC